MQVLNPVGWFEIYVQDMGRAKAFYEAVFQRPLSKIDSPLEMYGFQMNKEIYGASGALVKMEGVASGHNSTLIYFGSEDCSELARVVPNGGQVHRDKFSLGQYGFIALVSDTEGNMFGLHSMK